MPEQVYLVPAPGLRVLDPVTYEPLPAEGAIKSMTTYWRRRLRDGDVTKGQPPRKRAPQAQED